MFFWQLVTISFCAVDWTSLSAAVHQTVALFHQGCIQAKRAALPCLPLCDSQCGRRFLVSRVQRERIGGERERGKDQDQQEGLRVAVTVFCRKKPQALVSFLCWFIAHSNFILYRLHWLTKNFAPLSVYFSLFFSEYTYICTWKYSSSLSPLFFSVRKSL